MSEDLVSWTLSGTYDEDKEILVDVEHPARHVSRRKATSLVTRLAGSFTEGGVVCIHSANDVLYPILVLAILASSCTWTGSNPAYNSTELSRHLGSSGATYIITPVELLETVLAAVRGCTSEVNIIILTDVLLETDSPHRNKGSHAGFQTLHDLLAIPKPVTLHDRLSGISSETPAAFMPTSGTTGKPKMVARTHQSFIAESKAIEDNNIGKPYQIRRLYCTPVFHAFSFPDMVVNALRLGQPSFVQKRFGPSFARNIHRFEITEILATPSMLLALEKQVLMHGLQQSIQSLQLVLYGGASLATHLEARFKRLFVCAPRIVPAWGMTECGRIATIRFPEIDTAGSVGRPIEGYGVRQDLENTTFLACGQPVAELLVRGPQLMTGYIDHPTVSADGADGWLRTGDVGYIKEGKVFLVDRLKDMLKIDGWTVAPSEIEEAISGFPDVTDAAVVGAGQSVDEHAVLFVVATNIAQFSATRVKKHLLARLSGFKLARLEIRCAESIPRSETGKVLRETLKGLVSPE